MQSVNKRCQRLKYWLGLAFILSTINSFAMDSTGFASTALPSVNSAGATGASCTYFFMDIFNGTMASASPPTGTSFTLQFYNNGTPSAQSTAVPCTGTYKVVFNLELQAKTNVSQITIMPTVSASDSTAIYPSGGAPASLYLYPQCNNASYGSTPYCTIGEISGSATLTLNNGVTIGAPAFTASSGVTLLGGQFSAYLVSSP